MKKGPKFCFNEQSVVLTSTIHLQSYHSTGFLQDLRDQRRSLIDALPSVKLAEAHQACFQIALAAAALMD
ncbi:hypothetical protein [Paenibacillus periandrae]|uniref:hypothetical protein n=1 Tax=Paenibacillus periandrae TaxID=1761741 RepID=UPI001F0900AF|nr:hypothetical protein [Paenibacillus periandrae]